jgi:hypothetical protein
MYSLESNLPPKLLLASRRSVIVTIGNRTKQPDLSPQQQFPGECALPHDGQHTRTK